MFIPYKSTRWRVTRWGENSILHGVVLCIDVYVAACAVTHLWLFHVPP